MQVHVYVQVQVQVLVQVQVRATLSLLPSSCRPAVCLAFIYIASDELLGMLTPRGACGHFR